MLKILSIALVLWYIFTPIKASVAQAPEVALKDRPTKEIVQYYADQYGVDSSQLLAVMQCESGGNQSAIGDNGAARGIFQFHAPTFDSFSKKMGEKLDRESVLDQSKVASWAFANGLAKHWTCAKHLGFVR